MVFERKRGVRVEKTSRVATYDTDSFEVVRVSDVDPTKMQRADAGRARKSKLVQIGAGSPGAGGQGDTVRKECNWFRSPLTKLASDIYNC